MTATKLVNSAVASNPSARSRRRSGPDSQSLFATYSASPLRRLSAVLLLITIVLFPADYSIATQTALRVAPDTVELSAGVQTWRFSRGKSGWALSAINVRDVEVARPEGRANGFFVGSGEAQSFRILTNNAHTKAVEFEVGANRVMFTASASDRLPLVRVRLLGPAAPVFELRSTRAAPDEHGAWITRGFVATDADGSDAFIDSSGPTVFGHSQAGGLDIAYLFIPSVLEHVQKDGRTEQRSDTYFQSRRMPAENGAYAAQWQLRFGAAEPKEFAAVFDRDLGGRVSDVCEKYFADAVDLLVDLNKLPRSGFDPEKCLEVMPVRLAAPDAFVPGWGLMMDEFPKASYPFAHDSVWQTPALLAYEGLASGRDWERNFAHYFLAKTPLEGPDGKSFFVRRPGGLTRWGYFATYRDGFMPLDGGTWWQADLLYRTAKALNDEQLRRAALDMVLHDLNVKLNLAKMTYPPCWSPTLNRVSDDHRDDWFMTPGLAYCAYVAATIAYPETKDPKYLAIADKISEWFAGYIVPETKLNNLQGKNMHAVFSHYLTLAFLEKFDRSHESRFLDMARDMAWVHILTTCTTPAKDNGGNPLTGTTCVGVRECVDYDCSPNLCHEKDLTFVSIIGPLLDHVSGPAYAKYVALCRLVLDKDSWKSAWTMELRDTNLRTMYDTYARGMANLIYALEPSDDPRVITVEKLVSKTDVNIGHERDFVVANGTTHPLTARVRIPFLQPGSYDLQLDGSKFGERSHKQLAEGLQLDMPADSMRRVQVHLLQPTPSLAPLARAYDSSITWLSDLTPFAAQRGTGLPKPVYLKNQGFDSSPIILGGKPFAKGLGCAANTVLLYKLDGAFDRFEATVGVDDSVLGKTDPAPSVFFTVFVDGLLRFESGSMFSNTAPQQISVDVRKASMLMLRLSCNWDDNGQSEHDRGDWADARLIGKRK
jgi:hypothetical protein